MSSPGFRLHSIRATLAASYGDDATHGMAFPFASSLAKCRF
jgi:hypothetical protein